MFYYIGEFEGTAKMTGSKFITFITYISVLCYFVAGFSVTPCQINDDDCILKSAKDLASQIFATLDPMHHEKIEGKLSVLHFEFTNATVEGFNDCRLASMKISLQELLQQKQADLQVVVDCDRMFMTSHYEIDGTLIILPVKGKGLATIDAGKYKIGVNANIRIEKGKDGKNHFQIKNFAVKSEAIGGVKFNFQNLFNGQKELSDAVHRMANENWKEVASLVDEPLFIADFKQIISTANKFLKSVPVESLFI